MNGHDPLCFEGVFVRRLGITSPICICTIISAARADEREKAAQRVEQGVLGPEGIIFGCPFCGDPWESEPSCEHWAGIERLAAAVRGES